jgi:hypothetical protein
MADQHATVTDDAEARTVSAPERWFDDGDEELPPPRPRRRLLAPLPLALLAGLAVACGFISGVLVEKGQSSGSSASGAGGFASRFAALRGSGTTASSGASASTSASGATSGASGPGGASATSGAGGALGRLGGGATVGQVAYVAHGVLYVTTLEGNTVKVTAAPGATVTKSIDTTTRSIHPGETVVVSGTPGANGAIAAQSIRAGVETGGGLGPGALFGAGGRSSAASGTSSPSGGGGQALFGKG